MNAEPRLGVDTGGTFTDFVLVDAAGRLRLHKRLTDPADPAGPVGAGLRFLGLPAGRLVCLGSTIATNALLERRGARTALITTRGFADVLEIGRQNRPDLYALVPRLPPPLVPRAWRFEVNERLAADGSVLIPLDPAEIDALRPQLLAAGIESVAICLLFSFLNPAHENAILQQMAAAPAWPAVSISASARLLPEYREYERTAATVINAYVSPVVERYLTRLEAELDGRPLRIMQSNGGALSAQTARQQAARTVLSGPAGGVVGALTVARQSLGAAPRLITFDMGGTSTDVCLCPGQIPFSAEGEITGLPLRLPLIDIHTVGAGGGSLARSDAGGALTVGPESAGARPGPACYGRGGQTPTVTDANLALGRLQPAHFLGGDMTLDLAAARRALDALARDLQLPSVEAAAWGVVQVANAAMERAIRRISVERGYDPRDFVLLAFGGAGPLHACELAERLAGQEAPRVFIPRAPGVLSALGMLAADLVRDYSQTALRRLAETGPDELARLYQPLEERARAEADSGPLRLERSADLRYAGQSFELNVPAGADQPLAADFHARHAQRFGHAHPDWPVELVTVRVRAVIPAPALNFEQLPAGSGDPSAACFGREPVWFAGSDGPQAHWSALYARERLLAGDQLAGPAVIFQMDSTTVIPPGWAGEVDAYGHLLLSKQATPVS